MKYTDDELRALRPDVTVKPGDWAQTQKAYKEFNSIRPNVTVRPSSWALENQAYKKEQQLQRARKASVYTVEPSANFELSDMALFKDPNKGYVTPAGNKSLSDTVPVQMGPGEAPYLDPFNPVRQSDLLATQKANEEKAKAKEYKATHSLSEMLRETPKVDNGGSAEFQVYQDLLNEMYSKKGGPTAEDKKRIKEAMLTLDNTYYTTGTRAYKKGVVTDPARQAIAKKYYEALDGIPLGGLGDRLDSAVKNMGYSAAGTVDTVVNTTGRTLQKGYSNDRNEEFQRLTKEIDNLYTQMSMFQGANRDSEAFKKLETEYNQKVEERKKIDQAAMEKVGGAYQSKYYDTADVHGQNTVYGIENEAAKFAVETALSTANFGMNFALTGGNSPLTLALMGTQAGARAAHDAAKEGADLNQQLLAGIVGGGIEVLTEKLPIDQITEAWKTSGKNGLQRAVKAFVKGGIPEAGEEFVGEIANDIANSLIMGKPEQMQDPEFWTDTIKTAVRNAAAGFVSGGVIAAVPAALSGNAAQTNPQPQTQEAPSPSVQNNQVPQVDPKEYVSYIDQVSKSVKGELPPQDLITIGSTPDILIQHGAQQRTLTMNQNTVQKIAYPEGYMGGKHNLGFAALEQLPIQLQNPVAILKSDTQPNSFVIFTELLDTNNRPVMEAVHLDKKGGIGILNQVASMYSKDGFENFIATQEKRGNVLYTDPSRDLASLPETGKPLASMTPSIDPMLKKENQQPLPGEGLQLSKLEAATGSSINSIPQSIADGDIKNGTGGHSPRKGLQLPKLAVTTDSSTNSIYQSNENSNMFSELTQRLMAEKRAKENTLKNGPEGFEFTPPKSTGTQTKSSTNGNVVDLQDVFTGLLQRNNPNYNADTSVERNMPSGWERVSAPNDVATDFESKWGIKTAYAKPNTDTDILAYFDGDEIVLNADKVNTPQMAVSKVAHEATHVIQGTEAFEDLSIVAHNFYKDYVEAKTGQRITNADVDLTIAEEYARKSNETVKLSEAARSQEVTAHFIEEICNVSNTRQGEYIAKQAARLLTEKPNAFKRVVNYFKDKVQYFHLVHGRDKLTNTQRRELDTSLQALGLLKEGLAERKANSTRVRDINYSLSDSELGKQLIEKYGAFKPGENASREVQVPKRINDDQKIRQFSRTVLEAEGTPDSMVDSLEMDILAGKYSYTPIDDQNAVNYAKSTIKDRGYDGALNTWQDVTTGTRLATKREIALGEQLYIEAAAAGDTKTALKLAAELAIEGTRAGQNIQALQLLKKMTPEGQLYYIQKAVDKIRTELNQRYKGDSIVIKFDENTPGVQELLSAKTRADIDAATAKITKAVADQMPATWYDKWNAWRYMAMLGNPKTHIRNIIGNAVFMPVRKMKNVIGAGLEHFLLKDQSARTKALLTPKDRHLVEFAKSDFDNVADIVTGSGKHNQTDLIKSQRTIFKNKALEWFRNFNGKWLDKEDGWFLKGAYADSMAAYMKARGYSEEFLSSGTEAANKALQGARDYAILEAQKATYRDASVVANRLNQLKQTNAATSVIGEGLLPFTKTPTNILKRGIEYSPAGLLKSLTYDLHQVRAGNMTAQARIDNMASGLTGTGIMLLGGWLASMGILKGGKKEDKKEGQFDSLTGEQNYSLNIGDTSYTLDWMAPVSLPLFVGVEFYNSVKEERGVNTGDILDSMSRISEPLFEMSMLQGINSAIKSASYSGNPITSIAGNTAISYVGQAVPTLLGQVARTIDGTRRTTAANHNSPLPNALDIFLKKTTAKIPGASSKLEPYVDQWGREEKNDNVVMRFVENFLSPGYISKKNETNVDQEVERVYSQTGNNEVLPTYAAKSFTVNGETYYPTEKEYTQLSKEKGKTSYAIIDDLTQNEDYKNLSETEKATILADVYTFALGKAKQSVNPAYIPEKWITNAQLAEKKGIPLEQYILYKNAIADMGADKDSKGKAIAGSKKSKVLAYIKSMPITTAQKNYLIGLAGYKTK